MTKGEQTRQYVIAEAAKLFNQHGYEGCSLQELMQATGLEKGGIYRHFSSKEELAAEAFDHAWRTSTVARREGLDAIDNRVSRIQKFIDNFVERRSPIPGGCPLLNTAVDSDDGNAVLRKRAKAALAGWQTILRRYLEEGMERGDVRPGVVPEAVANVIIACLEGSLMISRLEKQPAALLQAREHLNQYLESCTRA